MLHAASQDLPCLAEIGLRPRRLFDTELAGRLAGYARVGLGAMVEKVLGLSLEKGHSAADWSTRPLPEPWLRYAALDVEVLRRAARRARGASSSGRASSPGPTRSSPRSPPRHPPAPRIDPWRRTSGMHRVRSRRQLAVVARAVGDAATQIARAPRHRARAGPAGRRDRRRRPGRTRATADALVGAAGLRRPGDPPARHDLAAALEPRAPALPDADLPPVSPAADGPPPAQPLGRTRPGGRRPAGRRARRRGRELADEHALPVENLLHRTRSAASPGRPPAPTDPDRVAAALAAPAARPWQVGLTAEALAARAGRTPAIPTG